MTNIDWIDRAEFPFTSHYFQTTAGRIHYVDEGSGEVILMLHANPAWSFLYRKLIKQLSGSYRRIAPDHIGFGLSDKPFDWNYLPEEHTNNLAALIEHLKLKDITLVVNDRTKRVRFAFPLSAILSQPAAISDPGCLY